MSRIYYTINLLFCTALFDFNVLNAQVNYTANNQVLPYAGGFHPSANIGEYTSFTDEQLGLLAAGGVPPNGKGIMMGAGVKALRPGLFEGYVEVAGYDARVPTFQYYKQLGMTDHTVIVGFPSPEHKDPAQHCPGIPSEMFANLYEPIWDGGANGTPYNDSNYYAAYLYKIVTTYKDYVRFWEIWNEPGYDYTGGLGYAEPGSPGNWWDNNPDPCDYKLRAPIFDYIRTLRISWEVIKTVDPSSYVVVSGTGYPSFLDAILRNTDNPVDGSVNAAYPLKGGAYFDVMGFHSYPHFDGSLREWSNELNNWIYYRHSDAAAQGLLRTKAIYQEVLDHYGYNGVTYPEKLWMVTEINLPRKPFSEYIGSSEAQKNFIIKAMTTAMMNDFIQLHIYKLAEDTYYDGAYSEFDLMGLYKRLDYNDQAFQEMNDEGIAHKTASDILFGKTYNPQRTAQLNLDSSTGGAAFTDEFGNYLYVLWAKTQTDQSETANTTYSFPAGMNVKNLLKCTWNASLTHDAANSPSTNIALTATPVFLTERIFSMNQYHACVPFNLQLTPLVNGATSWLWTIEAPNGAVTTLNTQNGDMLLTQQGTYNITLEAKNTSGQIVGKQTQSMYVGHIPYPAFGYEIAGPIVHFNNLTPAGNYEFTWYFGDGTTVSEPNPTHVYLQSGLQKVTLIANAPDCGAVSVDTMITVVAPPGNSPLGFTANDTIPAFKGYFRPSTSWDFVPGWSDEQIADLAAGNPLEGVQGAGLKSLRTYIGESFFLENGYDVKLDLFKHYHDIDLSDNTFLLAFPSVASRDPYYYCPDRRSALFKDLYLDIWDNGENGTPVNDANSFALYVWNTVSKYKNNVKYWEVYNSPDFDLTGDKAWLPPGEPGNWWENNPDPCDYELNAPIFYYIRSLRIAYEIIHSLDPEAYVTISGIAFPSFLDAVCRNTDNPLDGTAAAPYPLKGGAYFDAVGFKSYPHFDGSTIFFDVNAGAFAYERHSDAAVSGIPRLKNSFQTVLKKYGYDGVVYPEKEWTISEANVPRRQFYDYFGTQQVQRNWIIKAWVEAEKNNVRKLNIFKLTESERFSDAVNPFQVMGLYEKLQGLTPYHQIINQEGISLRTCSNILFGTRYDAATTAALQLPAGVRGAAFKDAAGNYIFVLWAETTVDLSETANATYSFPTSFNISQLHLRTWDYSQTNQSTLIPTQNIALTGAPVFLSTVLNTVTTPVAFFKTTTPFDCVNTPVQFTDYSTGSPTYWEWSFPGGTPSTFIGKTPPEIFYSQSGTYPVSLLVKNAAGEHAVVHEDVVNIQATPIAAFDVEINGAAVQFVNLSKNATEFKWCYGDGFCDNPISPLYIFFQNGTYETVLTAKSHCGEDTAHLTLNIGAAPTANFGFNFWGNCDELLTQFVDMSYSNPVTWKWMFQGGSPATSSLQFPTTTFADGGWKKVSLVVTNSFGSDTLEQQVYIEGPVKVSQSIGLCSGSIFAGQLITQDTVIEQLFATANLGCDSVLTTTISVVENIETNYELSICEGEWFKGVKVYFDTVFTDTTQLPVGCDSISIIKLTVLPSQEVFLTETIEQGSFFIVGPEVFTQSGQYDVLLISANGCDSLVHLDLTVVTGSNEVKTGDLVLEAFPNPFSAQVNIAFLLPVSQSATLDLFDMNGRLIESLLPSQVLPAGEYWLSWAPEQAGVFWLRLITDRKQVVRKLVKIRE
jgi:PKD repeat protein